MPNVAAWLLSIFITLVLIFLLAFALAKIFHWFYNKITIFEYERGLQYYRGRFVKILPPGEYWFTPFRTTIQKIDRRTRYETLSGQEVLASDGVTLKVSLAAAYDVSNPNLAVNTVADFRAALHLQLQGALREIIGGATVEELFEKRNEFSEKMKLLAETKAETIGLKIIDVSIRDIMVPGPLKQIFAQVVKARKEGQATLEKARGETAALRNLANAAKMIEDNPALLQLRVIQTLSETTGNTLVFGVPDGGVPIFVKKPPPKKTKNDQPIQADETPDLQLRKGPQRRREEPQVECTALSFSWIGTFPSLFGVISRPHRLREPNGNKPFQTGSLKPSKAGFPNL